MVLQPAELFGLSNLRMCGGSLPGAIHLGTLVPRHCDSLSDMYRCLETCFTRSLTENARGFPSADGPQFVTQRKTKGLHPNGQDTASSF